MNRRLRALCDLSMSTVREYAGRHEYDGRVEDLSPDGVRSGLARLGAGPPGGGGHDEAHLLYHTGPLAVSCAARGYAPAAGRAEARRRHLAAWPDAVEAAVTALDRVAAPVAEALLPAAQGLIADLEPQRAGDPVVERALAAHKRLVAHLEAAAADGLLDTALGRGPLERLLGTGEAMEVD